MSQDALDHRAKQTLSRKEKQEYARKKIQEDERHSMLDPRLVKKQSDKFRAVIEAQLKAAGIKK